MPCLQNRMEKYPGDEDAGSKVILEIQSLILLYRLVRYQGSRVGVKEVYEPVG